jgi:hypothetical protein
VIINNKPRRYYIMSKKLLSEAQVRKFMGLANLDANVSSNFINEMYHEDDEEEEEGMHDKKEECMLKCMIRKKRTCTLKVCMIRKKKTCMKQLMKKQIWRWMRNSMEVMPEEADESEVDVELDQDEVAEAKAAADETCNLLNKLMGGAAPEMDDAPAEEPEMDMGMDAEEDLGLDETTTTPELTEDEIVQEVAKRVAKRINEAAKKD